MTNNIIKSSAGINATPQTHHAQTHLPLLPTPSPRLTRELIRMRGHVAGDEVVAVCDHEAVVEGFHDGSDETISGSVERGRLGGDGSPAPRSYGVRRLGEAGAFQELAANDARVTNGGLVDGERVVGQVVGQDESTMLVLGV